MAKPKKFIFLMLIEKHRIRDLNIDINIYITLNAINIAVNPILLVIYNDRLKFIVVAAQKREMHPQRFNFESDTFFAHIERDFKSKLHFSVD